MRVVGEYTVAAIVAPVAVVALEFGVLRTGLFREGRYWITLAVVLTFQIPVDGWLTGGDPPVVKYDAASISGLRLPLRIPVEDFGFGFALLTLTLLLWRWHQRRRQPDG